MDEETPSQAKASSIRLGKNAAISLAADLANDKLNSICRIALSWISNGKVQGVSYLVNPCTDDFTCRKVTPEMVADKPLFADVWDTEISPLIKDRFLAAYHTESLFLAIKASYEASGRQFSIEDSYIRDLKFLSMTYLADLGNSSFTSIMHYMQIPVDIDDALSRAMGCACGINWLERLFPISNYGIPLSSIMAGALRPIVPPAPKRTQDEEESPTYQRLNAYARSFFIPFLLLCMVLTGYYLHRHAENEKSHVDFSAYSLEEAPSQQATANAIPTFDTQKTYLMLRGTYLLPDKASIPEFIKASKDQDVGKIRTMVRSDEIFVLTGPAKIHITGDTESTGFVPVTILEGDHAGMSGYAPYTMISAPRDASTH